MPRLQGISNESSMFVEHDPVDLDFGDEPSRTRQEFAEECDINTLMSRFERTGVISHVNPRSPMYLDLSEGVPDLQSAMDMVRIATDSFMSLPAAVRRDFDNDPVKFVMFAEDPANIEKLREWGLAKPSPVPAEPLSVRVISDEPAPGAGSGGAS